jgi:EAL domain-containing protein (putative c-di-GMP-specific phosphodiesterase class I)
MVGNVNKLKNVNDLYGSDMGDMVLIHIAKTIEALVGEEGTCGRFGGGVFAIFVEDKPEYLDQIITMESFNASRLGVFFPITIRFGMYRVTDHNLKLANVVNLCTYAADKATDRTKNSFIEYSDLMRREMQEETEITLKMREAMADGEFVLYVQPQYNHLSGKMVGAEALCRWVKQDGSIVSPGVFIPIFEKNGFIKELDKYVWETAFKQVQAWEKAGGPQVPISVNISRISLENDTIVDVIRELSKKYPVDKKHLYFEITESAYMKDQAALTERVYKLKDIGFAIAMDDFGSGYSSLNSLKDIPIDVLKLDMGFLRGGTNVERGNEIIAYMVSMAKALNLKMVAEGVETKEQAEFLKEIGCTKLQGFYYCKAISLEEIFERYRNGTAIGFENPDETEYYVQLGKVNLYDLSFSRSDDDTLKDYFDTWPMVIFGCQEDRASVIRCNITFREFMARTFPDSADKTDFMLSDHSGKQGDYSLKAVIKCAKDGRSVIIDDRTRDGKTIQLFIRRVAVNPVNGISAVAVAILSVVDNPNFSSSLTYNYAARAL